MKQIFKWVLILLTVASVSRANAEPPPSLRDPQKLEALTQEITVKILLAGLCKINIAHMEKDVNTIYNYVKGFNQAVLLNGMAKAADQLKGLPKGALPIACAKFPPSLLEAGRLYASLATMLRVSGYD